MLTIPAGFSLLTGTSITAITSKIPKSILLSSKQKDEETSFTE